MVDKNSYTAANSLPLKILSDLNNVEIIKNAGKIRPKHIQICPTNTCNLNCEFCSCDNRQKKQKLSYEDMIKINHVAERLGTRAYTVTGGGEPTLHPQINEFLTDAYKRHIKLGLVSNGLTLEKLDENVIPKLTWARISFDDSRKFEGRFEEQLDYMRLYGHNIDMAFSYVVGENPNYSNMEKIIDYANEHWFTHIRFVPDLYKTESINMNLIKEKLALYKDLDLCIFQNRADYTEGSKDCLISLLKPVIAPDGYVYPCCGIQYALPNEEDQRAFPKQMRMGHYSELEDIVADKKNFDGSICSKCYYENYNILLDGIRKDYQHKEFI